jgi:hypothetical protein
MSDFASLLGSLKKSATQAKEDARSGGSGERDRKRRAATGVDGSATSNNKKHCPTPSEPRDKRELTLSISFFCIGAQKAGTTWLHEMLRQHRSLCLPTEKEIHFWDWHRRKGLGWYCRQFPNAKTKSIAKYGECTPCYMTLPEPDIAEIKLLFPDAKLIFLARDLIDRAWSALLMELRNAVRGVEVGKFTINDTAGRRQLDQMDKESNPDNYDDDYFLERLQHSTHRVRSDYATGLRRWLQYFDKDQLLIVDYNKISENPKKLLGRICDHIGVEDKTFLDKLSDDEVSTRKNAAVGSTKGRTIRPSLRKKMESYLRPFAKDFNTLLDEMSCKDFKLSEY